MKQNGISDELRKLRKQNNRKQRVVLNGENSSWTNVHAGIPQGSILGPLLFLIYINDVSDDLTFKAKIFTDDTLSFSIVHDVNTSAKELNDDLKTANDWVFQWKMGFNPDPNKQAQEVLFSRKSKIPTHPPLLFNSNNDSQPFPKSTCVSY